jgi:hypothetical protein
VSPGVHDPRASPFLLRLVEIAVFEDNFDSPARGHAHHTGHIAGEQLPLAILQGGNVHHHIDFLGAEAEDLARLVLLHRGGLVAVWKSHHRAHQHAGAAECPHGQPDVVRLHRERRRA